MGHTGVFLQKLKCVSEESSFFLIIKNRTKCYEGPSKQKKTNTKTKNTKKKLLRIITFKTIIVFSKSVSEKQKYYF